ALCRAQDIGGTNACRQSPFRYSHLFGTQLLMAILGPSQALLSPDHYLPRGDFFPAFRALSTATAKLSANVLYRAAFAFWRVSVRGITLFGPDESWTSFSASAIESLVSKKAASGACSRCVGILEMTRGVSN